jgi:hypothetical protein
VTNLNPLATWCKNHNEWDLHWQSSPAQQNIKLKLKKLISEKSWFDLALALEKRNFTVAQQRLQELQPTVTVEQRKKSLLTELLTILSTNNYFEQRQAWRRYLAYLAEYAVIGYEMLEKENRKTWWQRLLRWHKIKNDYTDEKKHLAQLGAWSLITTARQEDDLPAWEGIRIVRDRTSESGFSE